MADTLKTDVDPLDVQNFDSASFLARRAELGTRWRWDNDNRYEAILHLMHINNLQSASQLKVIHFTKGRFDRAYSQKINIEFDNLVSVMVVKTLAHHGITLDPARFKQTVKERKDMLASVPVYTPPDENGELLRNRCDVEAMLPEAPGIVADLVTSLGSTDCDYASLGLLAPGVTVQSDVFNGDHTGVVYVAVVVSSGCVIYVGSTTHLYERVKTHKIRGNNGDNKDLYKYLADNNLVIGEGVAIVPIWTGPVGFETLVEAACYDALKAIHDDGGGEPRVTLQNGCRPLKLGIDINTRSYIYEISQGDKRLYIGSTNNFNQRKARHNHNCYTDKVGNKLYSHIRSINDTVWPEGLVKVTPIELVPIYVRYAREKQLIVEHDLINNGLNSANLHCTPQEKKEHVITYNADHKEERSAYNKQYRISHREEIDARQKVNRKIYYESHKEDIKAHRQEHREEIATKMKKWRNDNVEHRANYMETWREKNAEHVKNYTNAYTEKRKQTQTKEQKEQISQRNKERYKQKMANITDEERNEMREKKNKADRERRARKKAEASAAASSSTAD